MNKRGSITVIAIILALIILGTFVVELALRECNNNSDCPANAYCGSDYECHEYPDEILVKENNFVLAAIIIGVALIIAAYVKRGGKMPRVKNEAGKLKIYK